MPRRKPAIVANRLLNATAGKDLRGILAGCVRVELTAGDILHEAGRPVRHVYFPTGCCFALATSLGADPGLVVALVGNEGMLGVSLLLGVSVAPCCHLIVEGGSALRVSVASFRRELAHNPELRNRLNRYACVKMHQIAQTAVCTAFHLIEARLSRLLLMTYDRTHPNTLHATHASLARMLGVRRVSVTKAATALQKRAIIRYSRGQITIVDRRGLEASACACYRANVELYDRVLGQVLSRRH
jgi:CRP-like cAMP-binding protein